MLPLESLKRLDKCIVHGGCPDGRAAALIIHAALPDLPISEMTYGSPEHKALEPGPILFADFSPWVPELSNPPTPAEKAARRDVLLRWKEAGACVLDHHDPDLVEPFGEQGVFGDNGKGESGADLVLREVFLPAKGLVAGGTGHGDERAARDLAYLAATRDTWRRERPDWNAACALSEALRFVPLADLLTMTPKAFMAMAEPLGPILLRKKREDILGAVENAVRFSVWGRSVAVVEYGLASDVAEAVPDDLVAGFDYRQEAGKARLRVTLRSRKGVDCRAIALRNGGGGHVPAAGFSLPVDGDPYRAIARALEE